MKTNKIPYNKLTNEDKQKIIDSYYLYKDLKFKELAELCGVSDRAYARVLKENNIDTHIKNRYTLNQNYFETIDTEHKAYWLGFIYADGYVGDENYNNIVIGLSDKDFLHLEKFKNDIEYTGDIRLSEIKQGFETENNACVINFSNKKMASDLRALKLYPNKSTTMTEFPNIPEDLIKHFIRGYFDGDGSITDHIRNDSHNHRFIMTILGTIDFLNIMFDKLPVNTLTRPCKSSNMQYLVCSKTEDMIHLFHYFYDDSTIYLDRKYNVWKNIIEIYGHLEK